MSNNKAGIAGSPSAISLYSAQQINEFADTYARDGVVYLPKLLNATWIEKLLRCVEDVSSGKIQSNNSSTAIQTSRAPGRLTIRWMWREIGDVAAFFTDTGVDHVVAAVLRTKTLKYWYDLTFYHQPNTEDPAGSPWHHDIAAFPLKGTHIPSLWIALTDVAKDNSPLKCLRGSHKNRAVMYRPPVYVNPDIPIPSSYAEMPDFEARIARGEEEVLTWNDIAAGDALIIHPHTIHGAEGNKSKTHPRIAFTTRWAGDDVVWRPDVYSMKIPGIDLASVEPETPPVGDLFPRII